MGFTFSGIHKGLSSERFRKFYQKLRAACPRLLPFPDHASLIAFFHDQAQDLDEKDIILYELIALYRKGHPFEDLAPFFMALFTPALSRIYAHGKRKCPDMEHEDLVQDICLILDRSLKETEITTWKVASRIIGRVKNLLRSYLIGRIKTDPFKQTPGLCSSRRFVAFEDDDSIAHEPPPALLTSQDAAGEGEPDIADAETFLEHLVASGKITEADRDLIKATVLLEVPLKDIASDPKEYERLKKRRQRALLNIRQHLIKSME